MENEIMNNEVEYVDEVEVVVEEQPKKSGIGLAGLAIGGLVTAGAVALACKFKPKWEAHQIKKLEKRGYVVYKPTLEYGDTEAVEEDVEVEVTED